MYVMFGKSLQQSLQSSRRAALELLQPICR
jgi:hypothetical protein